MTEFTYQANSEVKSVQVTPIDDGYLVTIEGHSYRVAAQRAATGQLALIIDEHRQRAFVAVGEGGTEDIRRVWLDGQAWTVTKHDARTRRRDNASDAANGALSAAMPGQVREVLVAEGETVLAGAPLVILEAMKMEMRITAPFAGIVSTLHCSTGDVVERGQLLVELLLD